MGRCGSPPEGRKEAGERDAAVVSPRSCRKGGTRLAENPQLPGVPTTSEGLSRGPSVLELGGCSLRARETMLQSARSFRVHRPSDTVTSPVTGYHAKLPSIEGTRGSLLNAANSHRPLFPQKEAKHEQHQQTRSHPAEDPEVTMYSDPLPEPSPWNHGSADRFATCVLCFTIQARWETLPSCRCDVGNPQSNFHELRASVNPRTRPRKRCLTTGNFYPYSSPRYYQKA